MVDIRTFNYEPYTFDNGTHFKKPNFTYFRSEQHRSDPIDTIIIHSMHARDSIDPYSPEACMKLLESYEYSAHYFIGRDGQIYQMVPDEDMAWHAGESKMPDPDGRTGVNKFSLGVELISNESDGFTDDQYKSFVGLAAQIMNKNMIQNILGHKHISGPGIQEPPKTDPWNFEWERFLGMLEVAVANDTYQTMKLTGNMYKS